ncbi:NADP-dependent oxidoreductase [Burkholderia sp. Ac-20379]|uniref:NADP-dependent oxidoreductase n=1 Tax=Burkholderia sp. Ac-20379 TaxID=2703900 RepID=UPI0019823D2F|nr:NADP-dependent oxidoreductase [Burkholderia sp. Ac-20379]MBN3724100.1 NADP-dependent oxidoreductase [Burkholderia sp. Ac-20379]
MTDINRQVLLVSRPDGAARLDNFKLVETPLAPLQDGELRVRNHFLSLDPYMRGRMSTAKSYAAPQALDAVMIGETAGEVIESRHAGFAVGDRVTGMFGWQTHGTSNGAGLRKLGASGVPLSAYLGVIGMPGVTAWYGLNRVIEPKRGETVVVSAASGAVGGVVGQLAKRAGCRVIGIAGGETKCRFVVETLGFDACVDYKAGRIAEDLAAAAPDGIDGCFENVGGPGLDATLAQMNAFGRIAVCGMIAGYDGQPAPITQATAILRARLRVQGFIVTEQLDAWPQALAELEALVANGELHYRETIAQGIERAPEAFLGMLKGHNFGKQLVALI